MPPTSTLHDLVTGITEVVSRTPSGRPANGPSLRPALSQDGATVAFQSLASNLVCEGTCQGGQPDINLVWDVFVYDRFARRIARVSTDIGEEWMENSRAPSLDDAGQVLAFGSRHPINGRDEARDEDLYVLLAACAGRSGRPQPSPFTSWQALKSVRPNARESRSTLCRKVSPPMHAVRAPRRR